MTMPLPSAQRLLRDVGGALARASDFRVGLGVSGATIVSGSCTRQSHSWISSSLAFYWHSKKVIKKKVEKNITGKWNII